MSRSQVLTKIPDLGDIGAFASDASYDSAFWDKISESIRKENEEFERLESRLAPRPEDLRKQFAM